jgi:hypothetical protein
MNIGEMNVDKPEDEPIIKNCLTCAHREGEYCVLSGYYHCVQRRHPSVHCDINLSGWQQRPSLWVRVKNWFKYL